MTNLTTSTGKVIFGLGNFSDTCGMEIFLYSDLAMKYDYEAQLLTAGIKKNGLHLKVAVHKFDPISEEYRQGLGTIMQGDSVITLADTEDQSPSLGYVHNYGELIQLLSRH